MGFTGSFKEHLWSLLADDLGAVFQSRYNAEQNHWKGICKYISTQLGMSTFMFVPNEKSLHHGKVKFFMLQKHLNKGVSVWTFYIYY